MKNWQKLLTLPILLVSFVSAQTRITQQNVSQYSTQSSPGNPPTSTAYFYFNGTTLVCVTSTGASCLSSGAGTVTSVTGTTNQVTVTGTTTPVISLPANVVISGSMTAASFIGTAAGGVGNNWLAAEGTDPGTEAAGKDLLYSDSATHTFLMSLNNGALQQVMGANLPTTAGSAFTLNLAAASALTGLKLPSAAGAVPTAQGAHSYDTTTNVIVCGDGTNTTPCVETFLVGGATGSTVLSGNTNYITLSGLGAASATEAQRFVSFPLAGILYNLCVQLDSAQPASQTLTFTVRDRTLATSTANTSLTISVPGSSAAGVYCDTTIAHAVTISTSHAYSISAVQGTGGGSAASAVILGVSAVYRPHR